MRVTSVENINIDNAPVTDQGKRVYRALLSTGARTTEELVPHVGMSEALVDLMLAHLMRHDVIKVKVR